MENGLAPDTPAVAVAAATRPDEIVVAGTVADIGAKLAAAPLPGPVLVFIGRVFAGVGVANDSRAGVASPSVPPAAQAFQRSRP
jgi:uroporphyrin-III C-methyltransferase / precorrin-2 dehydrogenase / sirohydrochlorin ferrochelatase